MHVRSTLAALAATALLATACGAGVSAPLAEDIPATMLTSMQDSLRATVRIDAAVDLDELTALVAAFPEFAADTEMQDDAETAQALALMDAMSLEFAKGDDLSSSFSFNVEGTPMVEFRQDAGTMAGMTSLDEMLNAEPAEVAMLMRLDESAIRRMGTLIDEPITETDSFPELLDQALAEAPMEIPDSILDLLRAGAAGEWVGIDGLLDLASLYESMGMTPEMLEMFVPAEMDLPTRDDVTRVITDSTTFTRLDDADGQAVYSGDVDADTFLRGAGDLYGQFDQTGMVDQMLTEALGDVTLPTIPGAVTVTFDGANFTSMTIHGVPIMAEAYLQTKPEVDDDRKAAFRSAVGDLENSRLDVVMSFRDHGNVGNLVEGVDATTIEWQEVLDLVGSFMADMGAMGGFDGGMGFDEGMDFEASGSAEDAAAQSLLRNAAVAQETHYIDHGTYTMDLADLEAAGMFALSPDEQLTIVRADEFGYCMEAMYTGSETWSFDSEIGMVLPGACF